MSEASSLFVLDVLPPGCGVEANLALDPEKRHVVAAQFRVSRRHRRWLRRRTEYSAWSGWFRYEDEQIALHWATFWEP